MHANAVCICPENTSVTAMLMSLLAFSWQGSNYANTSTKIDLEVRI